MPKAPKPAKATRRSSATRSGSIAKSAAAARADAGDRPLTAAEKAYVRILAQSIAEGVHMSGVEIARAAGYGGDDKVLSVTSARVRARPAVRAAIMDACKSLIATDAAPQAMAVLGQVMRAGGERTRAQVALRVAEGAGLLGPAGGAGSGGGGGITITLALHHTSGDAIRVGASGGGNGSPARVVIEGAAG